MHLTAAKVRADAHRNMRGLPVGDLHSRVSVDDGATHNQRPARSACYNGKRRNKRRHELHKPDPERLLLTYSNEVSKISFGYRMHLPGGTWLLVRHLPAYASAFQYREQ